MSDLWSRLKKLETTMNNQRPSHIPEDAPLRRALCSVTDEEYAVLRLVQPTDTDPITYADIQVSLAWTQYDYERAVVWQREVSRLTPPYEIDMSGCPADATEEDREDWHTREWLNQAAMNVGEVCAKKQAACDAACKRLGCPRPGRVRH